MTEVAQTIPPGEAVIVRPIGKEHTITVPADTIYAHPRVQRIFGESNVDIHHLGEDLVIGEGPIDSNEESTQFRVSRERGGFGHHRSIHHRPDAAKKSPLVTDDDIVVIRDDKDNEVEYPGISTKGADIGDFNRVGIETVFTTPIGVRIRGGVTASIAGRIAYASELLEREGIHSEIILRVSRPKLLPIPDPDKPDSYKLVPQTEYKEWLLQKAEKENANLREDLRVDIEQAREWLMRSDNDLVVISRALMPFRLSDVVLPFGKPERYISKQESFKDFAFMMNYAISFLNRNREEKNRFNLLVIPKDKDDTNAHQHNEEAIARFFSYSARNLGETIKLLHTKKMYHDYLHGGNITIDGTICDIDSIDGVPFGKSATDPSFDEKFKDDYDTARTNLYNVAGQLSYSGIISEDTERKIMKDFEKEYSKNQTE